MPTPSTLTMNEPEPQASILLGDQLLLDELLALNKSNYKIGFVDGIIASSAAYLAITIIALFIGSYYQ